ncbi:MAG: formate--tetrahydrofolate ligase, partial [Oscillospiraceae bacterium]|nr:formate--tetrahydrofolate ligase [Oscillospiraceae bacterium]
DLGAEKFCDIKCRFAGLKPDCAVIVATIRALKYNGGVPKAELSEENVPALEKGMINLVTHIENMRKFGLPVVVAINRFHTDTEAEIAYIKDFCSEMGAEVSLAEIFAKGGEGGIDLAEKVCRTIEKEDGKDKFKFLYDEKLPIKEKLNIIAKEIYRADGVNFTTQAEKSIKAIEELGFGETPVCVAKTQYSLSDDPTKLGKPENFSITVRDVKLSAGAGFVVALTGDIMIMPGLPKSPAALRIDCDNDGNISGLF